MRLEGSDGSVLKNGGNSEPSAGAQAGVGLKGQVPQRRRALDK